MCALNDRQGSTIGSATDRPSLRYSMQAAVPWSRLTIELYGLQPISRDGHFFFSTGVPRAPSLRGCSFSFEPCIARTLDQIPPKSSCMANGMDHDGNELTSRSAIDKARRPRVLSLAPRALASTDDERNGILLSNGHSKYWNTN